MALKFIQAVLPFLRVSRVSEKLFTCAHLRRQSQNMPLKCMQAVVLVVSCLRVCSVRISLYTCIFDFGTPIVARRCIQAAVLFVRM